MFQHDERVAAFVQYADAHVDERRRAVQPRREWDDVHHVLDAHAVWNATPAQRVAHFAVVRDVQHVRYSFLHFFYTHWRP